VTLPRRWLSFHLSFHVQGVIMKALDFDREQEQPPYSWLTDAEHEQLDVPEAVHHRSHHRQPDITLVVPPTRQELELLERCEHEEREARRQWREEARRRVVLARAQAAEPVAPPARKPRKTSWVQEYISRRALAGWSTQGPASGFIEKSEGFWGFLLHKYFRVSTTGWERVPDGACLIVGIHAGTWLTMDAWMLMTDWWFRFRGERILHGTAHDVLMAMPGIGGLFRKVGVVPAARDTVGACLAAGHSVVVWPGGEVDSMRSWARRHTVTLDGRKGFVRQAIRSGVPIVPVATVGGAETVIVLSEGRWLAKKLRLKQWLRSDTLPIVAGLPFGLWPEVLPSHIPLPAKITNEFLEPVPVEAGRENDEAYVQGIYDEVERRIQAGVSRLAKARRLPLLG
jgi:1-acyl-sn-glycerol-3-phosphate acyltransferase